MNDNLEVYLSDSAEIPCHYSFTDADKEPSFVMIQWFVRAAGNTTRTRIFYGDGSQQIIDNNTDYSSRINVTSDHKGTILIIKNVQLSDEREFFCQVNGLAAGNAERKTHLRVFAPPAAPVIEGVLTGISVTNSVPSKVASCEAQNGFPKPNITWYRNGLELTPSSGYVNILTLVTRESSGFSSVPLPGENGHSQRYPSASQPLTEHFHRTRGPQMVGEEEAVQLEEVTGRTVNLSCEVKGHPPPSITWSVIGSQNWQEVVSKANDHVIHSTVSVLVTSDVSALCNASNDMGTDVKAFSIKAIPRVTTTASFSPVEGGGVIIVVIILCLLLLAVLGSVFYFLHKKGKIPCGRSGKQEITKEKATKDDIVVEMKTNTKNEEAVLLKGVNGEKKGPNDQ
uniref:Melanoma cell adhesion molecule n=1 Tax=Nothobranchius korthausae TaxID=1143690 RepID=A0A1A8F6F0_9TELE